MSDDNSQEAETGDAAGDARRWLLENTSGTLGTLSVDGRCAGYPFASIVPFALDARGRPIVQIASIAAHTRNVKADPRVSLFVHEPNVKNDDPQAGWRITLLGKLAPIGADEEHDAMARFCERVPRARAYEATHDFSLWRLEIEHVRYIGGFGRICWIEGARVMRDPLGAGLADAAPGAIAHMNADHAQSMIDMCTGLYGFTPQSVTMTHLDRAGFLVETKGPDKLVHFSFGKEIDAQTLRHAVVDVVKRARAVQKPA
jgi:hypothetical protein